MRIALYSPYLDTLGGGERYMMTIAESLSKENEVNVLLDQHLAEFGADHLKNELSERFNLSLSKVHFINGPIGKGSNTFQRIPFFRKYDALFYLTDGSIFFPSAKKNILHIQSPLVGQAAKFLWGKIKLKGWNLIIYNSEFTKNYSQNSWPIFSQVIYPPVDTKKIIPLKKKKYILSVGRFSSIKKHEVLIKVFKELYEGGEIKEWSLQLVGSAADGDKPYLDELKDLALNLPVNFYPNLSFEELVKLYGESSIYWHAAGYDESDPTKMEHFGISTVEAMAAGCVPIVISKGGQSEIVEHKKSGFLWSNIDELRGYTLELISKDNFSQYAKKSIERSKKFSKEEFSKNILKLI